MADNLESYIKKHLTDNTPAGDKWNVPPDSVWDKVAPRIQKKKGLFIPWKYIYLLGLIAAVALMFLLWPGPAADVNTAEEQENNITQSKRPEIPEPSAYENTTAPVNDESARLIQPSENNIYETQANMATQTSSVSEEAPWEAETAIARGETFTPGNTQREINHANLNGSNHTAEQFEDIPISGKTKNTAGADVSETIQDNATDKYELETMLKKTLEHISPQGQLVLLTKTNSAAPEPETASGLPRKKLPFDNKGRLGIGAYFTPTLTSTYLSANPDDGHMEAGNMFLYSNNWGIELRYHLSNRFTLFGGVGKSEIKSWSKSFNDFNYDLSTENVMGISTKENTSPVAMDTPFGEINTAITYRFASDQSIPDKEVMQSMLETHQEVKYLSIPLGVEYNLIRFSHFNWIAETGLRYNRALKDATQFSSRILHNGDEMDVVEEKMTSHPTYTENYLSILLGTGINYQFSKAFRIAGSARYSRSITPVNLQNNMATRVHEIGLKIGLVYLF